MLRDKGDLFLPFEERITRDYTGLRQAFASRRARRHVRGKSADADLDVPVADTLSSHTVKGTQVGSVMTSAPPMLPWFPSLIPNL